jgi:hypothetical protein
VGYPGDDSAPLWPSYYAPYGSHLQDFFELWKSDTPLEDCLISAETANGGIFSDLPLDPHWRIYGNPLLTRTPQ